MEKYGKKRPAKLFGRGLIDIGGENIYEFQTARICDYTELNEKIDSTIKEITKTNKTIAKKVPIVPDIIKLEDIKDKVEDISKIPLGIEKSSLELFYYDFKENFSTLIASKSMETSIEFLYNILETMRPLKNVEINILDAEHVRQSNEETKKDAFEKFEDMIEKSIESEDKDIFNIFVIIGISKFASEQAIEEMKFNSILTKASKSGKCSLILVDNPRSIETIQYTMWYSTNIGSDKGIWIGSGVAEQGMIRNNIILSDAINSCDNSYGIIIGDNKETFIKLVGMQDKNDQKN